MTMQDFEIDALLQRRIREALAQQAEITSREMHEMAHKAASAAVVQTFRLFGIKITEEGMDDARKNFMFLDQLRSGSKATRGLIFKTIGAAMVMAGITLIWTAVVKEVKTFFTGG